jgi:hypothetical protein
VGLLIAMIRVSRIQIDYERFPTGDAKRLLLRAIERAGKVFTLSTALRITRLSASRYRSWQRAETGCDLEDRRSCPRVVPTRLPPAEIETM